MYHVLWDRETNGILLAGVPPEGDAAEAKDTELRPVFHEELDLLGFQQWEYPRVKAPLLWAIGREYYYRGEVVAKAAGGSFYQKPVVQYVVPDLVLQPVNLAEMARRNAGLLDALAQRAIEFIRREYEQRRSSIDVISVAFSGGKDSVVVLDLVQRALPPDAFVVVFGDTTMEISATYDAVEDAKRHWPQLTFLTARSHIPAVDSWKLFGPPSRIHRWCCTVHKSAPSLITLRALARKSSFQALVLDGIRHAESQRRSTYEATTVGGKHMVQINASPVIRWNAAEIFAYTFSRMGLDDPAPIPINDGYRHGLARVGCAVCPFSSKWGECITGHAYMDSIQPLLMELQSYAARDGRSGDSMRAYLESGQWKMRSGGRVVLGGGNHVDISEHDSDAIYLIQNPHESWREWAKTIGEQSFGGVGEGVISSSNGQFAFSISVEPRSTEVRVSGIPAMDRDSNRDFRAIAFKSAYCVHCRACEVECPTGALTINGMVSIDLEHCIHCRSCLTYVDKGCWRAKSITVSQKGAGMKGINAYQTFGMSVSWLDEYLADPVRWWRDNSLGPRQFEAMKVWLEHAGILDRATKNITPLGERILALGTNSLVAWGAIWTELARNSVLVRWYVSQVPFGSSYSKDDLMKLMQSGLSPRTISNALLSLFKLLEDTPLGTGLGLGIANRSGRAISSIYKQGSQDIPQALILYSLYDYSEHGEKYSLTLSELVEAQEGGPARLFGVPKEQLINTLRGLSSQYERLLRIEFARGLENIYLDSSLGRGQVLDMLMKHGR